MDEAYEELLEESCKTIVDLRLEMQQLQETIRDQRLLIRSLVPGSCAEWGAFCDEISDEEWEGEPEYQCSTCGAPVAAGHSGRCSMPCI